MELALSLLALGFSVMKLIWMYLGSKNKLSNIDPVPWMIWGMLSVAMIVAQVVEAGWEWALLFSIGNAVLNWLVVWVSRKHDWRPLTPTDWLVIAIAMFGVAMWLWRESASDGMLLFLAADAVGAVLMVIKVCKDPWHERQGTWLFGIGAAVSAYASALYADAEMVGWYPLYVIGNSSLIWLTLMIRRKYVSRPVVEADSTVSAAA